MIDLKAARQDPDRYRAALARRGAAKDFDALLAADAQMARVHRACRDPARRAEEVVQGPARRPRRSWPELRQLAAEFTEATEEQAQAARERDELLARIPNLPDPTAADGMDEEDSQLDQDLGRATPVQLRAP